MHKKIHISDSELPIMKVLWWKGPCMSPELFERMDKNVSTLKTLLGRLVDKGAVEVRPINSRMYLCGSSLHKKNTLEMPTRAFCIPYLMIRQRSYY